MNKSIYNTIKNEYEKKQKDAFDSLMARKDHIYSCIPRIQEIDSEIQMSGVQYNKMILLGNNPVGQTIDELQQKIDRLKKEKQLLLTQAGYSRSYLEMSYSCPRCKDTGYIDNPGGAEKCSCYKQLLIDQLYTQSNLKLTERENFSCFDESFYPEAINEEKYGIKISPRENISRIRERCLRFIENFSSPNEMNLFFSGPTGVGKTFMSNCIASELLNKGMTVLYQTAPMLFTTINEYKAKAFKDDEFFDASYRNIFDVELLIIDDLGTESGSSARYAEFLTILNTRQMNNMTRPCKTLISTNIGIKELYEYYDERVASRIIGCYDMCRFASEDIRSFKRLVKR